MATHTHPTLTAKSQSHTCLVTSSRTLMPNNDQVGRQGTSGMYCIQSVLDANIETRGQKERVRKRD